MNIIDETNDTNTPREYVLYSKRIYYTLIIVDRLKPPNHYTKILVLWSNYCILNNNNYNLYMF